jgi:hypothetical protein
MESTRRDPMPYIAARLILNEMIKAYKAKLKKADGKYSCYAWALVASSQTAYRDGAGVVPQATAEAFALVKPINPERWMLKRRLLEAKRNDNNRVYPVSENAQSQIDSALFAPAINWDGVATDILQQLLSEMTGQVEIALEEISLGFAAVYLDSCKLQKDANSVLEAISNSAKLKELQELRDKFRPVVSNFIMEENVFSLFSEPGCQDIFSGQDWD